MQASKLQRDTVALRKLNEHQTHRSNQSQTLHPLHSHIRVVQNLSQEGYPEEAEEAAGQESFGGNGRAKKDCYTSDQGGKLSKPGYSPNDAQPESSLSMVSKIEDARIVNRTVISSAYRTAGFPEESLVFPSARDSVGPYTA